MDQLGGGLGEDGLAARLGGRVLPVGQALRATFDADNHETLGPDLTGLMIDLSKVPFDPVEAIRPAARVPMAPPPLSAGPAPAAVRTSLLVRLRAWLARLL